MNKIISTIAGSILILSICGCEKEIPKKPVKTNFPVYFRDKNEIVYASNGLDSTYLFFFTVIPENEVYKIPAEEILETK